MNSILFNYYFLQVFGSEHVETALQTALIAATLVVNVGNSSMEEAFSQSICFSFITESPPRVSSALIQTFEGFLITQLGQNSTLSTSALHCHIDPQTWTLFLHPNLLPEPVCLPCRAAEHLATSLPSFGIHSPMTSVTQRQWQSVQIQTKNLFVKTCPFYLIKCTAIISSSTFSPFLMHLTVVCFFILNKWDCKIVL